MPRTSYNNYATLAGDETQMPRVVDALEITNPSTGSVTRWATEVITYRSNSYSSRLRRISSLTISLNGGFSRASVIATNADLEVVTQISAQSDRYIGYTATLRKILTGKNTLGNTVSADLTMLSGIIVSYKLDETGIEFEIVTKANRVPLLSNRTVGIKCPWVFKGTECGYSGAESSCNKLYSDSGGCSGRSNQHRFGGFPVRPDGTTIGIVSGLGEAPAYQLVQLASDTTLQRTSLRFDDSFGVADNSGADATVVTAITPDWLNAQSVSYKAAGTNATTTGSITSGTSSLTVTSASGWKAGQGIRISGAGAAGAALTTTITAISGTTFTLAASASTTVSGASIGHDDSAAIQSALSAASTNDKTIYLPAGTYYAEDLVLNSPNSIHIVGAGPGCTILQSRGNKAILKIDTTTATAHSITIENLSFVGSGTGSGNYGLLLSDGGGQGLFNITVRNCRFTECGNSAIKTTAGANSTFTVLLEGVDVSQPSGAAGDAIDIYGSNDLVFVRCYVHAVASNKAAYRVRAGSPTFIGCNGIDSGTSASWGVFGQTTADDGAWIH